VQLHTTGHRRAAGGQIVAAAIASILFAGISVVGVTASSATTASKGTQITTSQGPFGTMLVVGSGKYAGYTLYYISSDVPPTYGCTTTIMTLGGQSGSCTGPSNDQKAEWPAITTTGAPIAGTGVKQNLLGTVTRTGIGSQVTYAGHPLYLFDGGPGQVFGEGWDEPGQPPYHGLWWLMAPSGLPLAWPGTLSTVTVGAGRTVLGAVMFTGGGFKTVPVYSFSGDTSGSSACTGACAVTWPPVLTSSSSGATKGLDASKLGSIKRSDGTVQVTYDNKPLYLYGDETPVKTSAGFAVVGNGNGVKASGGSFDLVTP